MNQIEEQLASRVSFKQAVVFYLKQGSRVLLGLRKKVSLGLGEDLIAGIGGKVGDSSKNQDEALKEAEETPEQAMVREGQEEIRVIVKVYRRMGRVRFIYPHKPQWNQDVTIYVVDEWEGEPQETEVIKPLWFDQESLPTTKMWPDNAYWVPKVLAGEHVDAIFLYDENGRIAEHMGS